MSDAQHGRSHKNIIRQAPDDVSLRLIPAHDA
jgi:hypothetical protein